jgi:hypothetical protein
MIRYSLLTVLLLAACGTNPPAFPPNEQIAGTAPPVRGETYTLGPAIYHPQPVPRYTLLLRSFENQEQAIAGWNRLARDNEPLRAMQPMMVTLREAGRPRTQLLAGLFATGDEAAWVCDHLIRPRQPCEPVRLDRREPDQVAGR